MSSQSILQEAMDRHRAGDVSGAEKLYRRYLKANKRDGQALHLLGLSLLQQNRTEEAVKPLRRACQVMPEAAANWANLGNAQQALGQIEEAIASFTKAIARNPDDPLSWYNLANAQKAVGDDQSALVGYRKAIELKPDFIEAFGNLADLLESLNQREEAAAIADQGLELSMTDPLLTLTRAKLYRRSGNADAGLSRIGGLLDQPLDPDRQAALLYEQGHLLVMKDDPDQAFQAFHKANQILDKARDPETINPLRFRQRLTDMDAVLSGRDLDVWHNSDGPDEDDSPVFLVGYPRSGTTLMDKIIGRLPEVTALEERPLLGAVRGLLRDWHQDHPSEIAKLEPQQCAKLVTAYWAAAKAEGWDGSSLLVDKMPLNMIEALLILRLWPKARFILAIRHPLDAVLSAFMQAFQLNDAMANFLTLQRAADLYAGAMAYWAGVEERLNPACLRVRYEDLVKEPECEGLRFAEFLGRAWDSACLDVVTTSNDHSGRIRTPSYAQVTEPIHARAIGRWQAFDSHLLSIKPVVSPWVQMLGYQDAE